MKGNVATLGTGKTEVSQFKENETKVQSDYVLTYANSFGDHNLTATAGFTTYYNSLSRLDAARGQGIGLVIPDNPDKWFVSIGDLATATNGSTQWERTTVSFLGRVIYNYKGKYLFNGSFRRDGSLAFSYTGNHGRTFTRQVRMADDRRRVYERHFLVGYVEVERFLGYVGQSESGYCLSG